jgi:hypothetical protein
MAAAIPAPRRQPLRPTARPPTSWPSPAGQHGAGGDWARACVDDPAGGCGGQGLQPPSQWDVDNENAAIGTSFTGTSGGTLVLNDTADSVIQRRVPPSTI